VEREKGMTIKIDALNYLKFAIDYENPPRPFLLSVCLRKLLGTFFVLERNQALPLSVASSIRRGAVEKRRRKHPFGGNLLEGSNKKHNLAKGGQCHGSERDRRYITKPWLVVESSIYVGEAENSTKLFDKKNHATLRVC